MHCLRTIQKLLRVTMLSTGHPARTLSKGWRLEPDSGPSPGVAEGVGTLWEDESTNELKYTDSQGVETNISGGGGGGGLTNPVSALIMQNGGSMVLGNQTVQDITNVSSMFYSMFSDGNILKGDVVVIQNQGGGCAVRKRQTTDDTSKSLVGFAMDDATFFGEVIRVAVGSVVECRVQTSAVVSIGEEIGVSSSEDGRVVVDPFPSPGHIGVALTSIGFSQPEPRLITVMRAVNEHY